MTEDNREKIIEQALRKGNEDREMKAYLDLLFSTPGRFDAMLQEARRRYDLEEGNNVIPMRRHRKGE